MVINNNRPKGLNGHLSISDSTLTSWKKSEGLNFAYQLLSHHKRNENKQWNRNTTLYSLNTIAINVMYFDMFGSEHFDNNQYLFTTLVNDYPIQAANFINSAFHLRKKMLHKWTVIQWYVDFRYCNHSYLMQCNTC